MRSAPRRLQTMLKLRLKEIKLAKRHEDRLHEETYLFSLIIYAIPNPSSIT